MINEKFKTFLEAILHNADMPDLRLDRWQTEHLSKLWEQRHNQAVKKDQMDAWRYAYLGRGNSKRRPPMEIPAPLAEKEENRGRYDIEVSLDPSIGVYTIFVLDRHRNVAQTRYITQKDLAAGQDEEFFKKLVGEQIDDCIRELKESKNG